MNIGKAVKELRISKGLNQKELADGCDLTQTSISQIETGTKSPNSGTIKKICNFFDIPELVVYLLATEESDIPETKRFVYQTLFPDIKNILINIFDAQAK
jgi:transcriptional regulator with XRE-family HTH domain